MPTYPYMLLDYMLNLADSWKDSSDGHITIGKCSSKEQKHIEINTSDITADVRNVMSIGYYIGALKVGMLEKEYLTSTNNVRLYIYYKPTDDTSKTVRVRLPHLPSGFYIYYKPTDDTSKTVRVRLPHPPSGSVIQNIAMSSHPDLDNEDWVVAIKFNGPQIKLYRPAYYLYSLDPNSKENDHPEFVDMFPDYLPEEHLDHDVDEMNSCATTVHFVDAASGEQFFVKWFFKDQLEIDIGDFCIFLGQGEPFCV
ncbi:hypothetical protein YC2023_115935 [Brassica napus]